MENGEDKEKAEETVYVQEMNEDESLPIFLNYKDYISVN